MSRSPRRIIGSTLVLAGTLSLILAGRRHRKRVATSPPAHTTPPLPPSVPERNRGPSTKKQIFDWLSLIAALATVIALIFTVQAARDTARQVRLTRDQLKQGENQLQLAHDAVQPTFTVEKVSADGTRCANGCDAADLALTINGSLEYVSVDVAVRVIFQSPNSSEETWSTSPSLMGFWKDKNSSRQEFRWKRTGRLPSALTKFIYDEITIVVIDYIDAFHSRQRRAFSITNRDTQGWPLSKSASDSCFGILKGPSGTWSGSQWIMRLSKINKFYTATERDLSKWPDKIGYEPLEPCIYPFEGQS
jgi:hypothetical protein